MTINTKMNPGKYISCVEDIANAYFDENGNYSPHIGRTVERAIFVDYCVEDAGFDAEAPDLIDQIFANEEISKAFVNEIYAYNRPLEESEELFYSNAHDDAMSIVEHRNSSLMQAVRVFGGLLNEIMSPENLEKVYALSDRFKNVLESNKDNVTELFPKKEG